MNTKEKTDMALRAALNYLRSSRKTPLQMLADYCERTRRHIQGISSETERKPMGGELAHKIAAFYGLTYEQFLNLGVCLLNGADGETVLTDLQTLASRENSELRHLNGPSVRAGWKNAAPVTIAVANGHDNHVANTAQTAPVSELVGGGEIERDLCERIVQYLKSKSTDEKIEFRARVKAFMEGQPGEVQSERL